MVKSRWRVGLWPGCGPVLMHVGKVSVGPRRSRYTCADQLRREITQLIFPPSLFLSSSSSFVSSSRPFSFLESVAATFARINFGHGARSEDQTTRYRLYIIDFINYKMEHRWLSRNTGEAIIGLWGRVSRFKRFCVPTRAFAKINSRIYLFLSFFLFFSPPGGKKEEALCRMKKILSPPFSLHFN